MVTQGLVKLLNNPHQANNTLLPSSMKQIACFQEVLLTDCLSPSCHARSGSYCDGVFSSTSYPLFAAPTYCCRCISLRTPSVLTLICTCPPSHVLRCRTLLRVSSIPRSLLPCCVYLPPTFSTYFSDLSHLFLHVRHTHFCPALVY